jgi:hypothetical protein
LLAAKRFSLSGGGLLVETDTMRNEIKKLREQVQKLVKRNPMKWLIQIIRAGRQRLYYVPAKRRFILDEATSPATYGNWRVVSLKRAVEFYSNAVQTSKA